VIEQRRALNEVVDGETLNIWRGGAIELWRSFPHARQLTHTHAHLPRPQVQVVVVVVTRGGPCRFLARVVRVNQSIKFHVSLVLSMALAQLPKGVDKLFRDQWHSLQNTRGRPAILPICRCRRFTGDPAAVRLPSCRPSPPPAGVSAAAIRLLS
jgi:hypothetical protein